MRDYFSDKASCVIRSAKLGRLPVVTGTTARRVHVLNTIKGRFRNALVCASTEGATVTSLLLMKASGASVVMFRGGPTEELLKAIDHWVQFVPPTDRPLLIFVSDTFDAFSDVVGTGFVEFNVR